MVVIILWAAEQLAQAPTFPVITRSWKHGGTFLSKILWTAETMAQAPEFPVITRRWKHGSTYFAQEMPEDDNTFSDDTDGFYLPTDANSLEPSSILFTRFSRRKDRELAAFDDDGKHVIANHSKNMVHPYLYFSNGHLVKGIGKFVTETICNADASPH